MDSQACNELEADARLPKHLRAEAKRGAVEELVHWWHATVGSSPMAISQMLARVPYPSRIHAALVTLTENGDPNAASVESELGRRLQGRLSWRTESNELKLRILMSSRGVLFQVTPCK